MGGRPISARTQDILFVVVSLSIAGIVYWSADQIPPSLLAKISAGLVPKLVAVAMAGLALLYLFMQFGQSLRDPTGLALNADETLIGGDHSLGLNRPVVKTSLLLGLYILVIQLDIAPFWLSSLAFVFASILALSVINARGILIAAALAAVSVSLTIVIFTQLFTVVLP